MKEEGIDSAEIDEIEKARKEDAERTKFLKRTGILLALVVVAAWIATPILLSFSLEKWADRANFGDQFGSINALFSGLALAGVVVTLFLQQRQLELQRKELIAQRLELRYTRAELKKSADAQDRAQEALNKTMYAQAFKVALDIFDSDKSLEARRVVSLEAKPLRADPNTWSENVKSSADVLVRVFESIGTLVRQGTVPAHYIVETWAIHIWRNWTILEAYIDRVRIDRKNPLTGREFQKLYALSAEYLEREGVKVGL